MNVQGEHRFAAPRQEVWDALLDADVLSRTVPGGEALEKVGENAFAGKLKIKVGPVQGVFSGKVDLSDLVEPESYKLTLEGKGPAGFVNGTGDLNLTEDGDETLMAYNVEAQVGGRIAGVGQRLIESSAKVITRQALEALDAQIAARVAAKAPASAPQSGDESHGAGSSATPASQAAPPRPAAAPPPAPTQAQAARGFLGGLFDEVLPGGAKPWLIGVFAAAAGFWVLMIRGCG